MFEGVLLTPYTIFNIYTQTTIIQHLKIYLCELFKQNKTNLSFWDILLWQDYSAS